MAITNVQEIQIELDGNTPFEYVVAKQGSVDSLQVKATLLQNKKVYTIPSGVTAQIKYYKPDGKTVLNTANISPDRTYITITYTEQMLAAAGTGMGEIVLNSGSSVLRSATYYTKIVPTVYAENGLISDSEFLDLAASIIALNQATDKALNAATVANAVATDATTRINNAITTAQQQMSVAVQEAAEATTDADVATVAAKDATAKLQATLKTITDVTQAANIAAAEADKAATSATASAKSCDGIAAGINTMTDSVDGKSYSLGVHGGKIQATEV